MASKVYVGVGSNWGDAAQTVREASRVVAQLGCHSRVSSLYRTAPQGGVAQPPYCNAVVEFTTVWPPLPLLHLLRCIEGRFGRSRRVRWGPRTLDLDLLLYGRSILDSPELSVPHPRMGERRFVLEPLLELDPDLVLPGGTRASELLKAAWQQEVERQ